MWMTNGRHNDRLVVHTVWRVHVRVPCLCWQQQFFHHSACLENRTTLFLWFTQIKTFSSATLMNQEQLCCQLKGLFDENTTSCLIKVSIYQYLLNDWIDITMQWVNAVHPFQILGLRLGLWLKFGPHNHYHQTVSLWFYGKTFHDQKRMLILQMFYFCKTALWPCSKTKQKQPPKEEEEK